MPGAISDMPVNSRRFHAQHLTLSAMLLSLMLVLGWVESMLPSPGIPGIKLGLSNSVLIFAVYMLDIPTAMILMSLKVLLSGIMFGGVSAMIYAFAGGLFSLTVMVLMHLTPRLHCVVISMAGGMCHNLGQVLMAILVLHTPRAILGYLGILMLTGLGCGALTGVCARQVMNHLRHVRWHRPESAGRGRLLILLSVFLVLFTLWIALRSMHRIENITVETLSPDTTLELTDASRRPF